MMLNFVTWRNALRWEWADLPVELPAYVSNLSRALQTTQAWIAAGGIVEQVVVAAPPTLSQPLVSSDGKSELGISDAELPSPQQVVSKVHQLDKVEHVLDKGVWVATGTM